MIILSSQADVNFGNGMGAFGKMRDGLFDEMEIDGNPSGASSGSPGLNEAADIALGNLSKLAGNVGSSFDPNFVGSGKQLVPGGSIAGGKLPPLENASVREVYNQSPQASILVKKRVFSSLSNLYIPALMDPDELWLLRATKKLFANKCSEIADIERITKISKLSEQGVNPGALATNLVSSLSNSLIGDLATSKSFGDKLGSYALGSFILEQIARAREPVYVTTWFQDQTLPIVEELGFGTGVFELTNVTSFGSNLSIEGEGNFNLSIEDPYSVMFISEGDIERAIRDTVLSSLINVADKTSGLVLASAQSADQKLSGFRKERNVSQISFSISIGNEPAVTAVIDATGYNLTPDNLDNVDSPQELTSTEKSLFTTVYDNLKSYAGLSKKTLMSGSLSFKKHKKSVEYVRSNMRFNYLGKNVIQPMDKVHIFVDSGTRKAGEAGDIGSSKNYFSDEGYVGILDGLGLDETGISESLLKVEWELSGKQLPFAQFRKIVTSYSSGMQIISGLVTSTTDSFEANGGLHTISVQGTTEMEWLKQTQYNSQPSLDQTQGIIFDPLTPFDFEVDVATGLPIGKPELTDANKKRLSGQVKLYAHNGPLTGQQYSNLFDMSRDMRNINSSNIKLVDHAPGLMYKWKEGIITAAYNISTANKFDKSKTNVDQLRRDIGFFFSNTAFDGMDVANILSVLITGQPYNYVTFVDSALRSGTFIPDALLNDSRDYFSVLMDVQETLNSVQGNFVPFKYYNISRSELNKLVLTQQKLGKQSSELTKLRNKHAKLTDKKFNLLSPYSKKEAKENTPSNIIRDLSGGLSSKIKNIENQIKIAQNELTSTSQNKEISDIVSVYGNDITIDYNSKLNEKEQVKLFGDNLIHATLKRKEDVIYNRDKTYFIVSDEYDKDYDIQAFVLQLKDRNPDMWESSWDNVYGLCKKAVDIINFEFFINTQGHLEFRPPQYNRTPLTVFEAIINYGQQTGANLLPDFLKKLFDNRETSLINEIAEYEWRIRLNASLLGAGEDINSVTTLLKSQGYDVQFITKSDNILQAANRDTAMFPNERVKLLNKIQKETNQPSKANLGLFNPSAQYNLQSDKVGKLFTKNSDGEDAVKNIGNEGAYKEAISELSKLTGMPKSSFEDFSKVKVGVSRNGVISAATDVSRIISKIAKYISKRSNVLKSLERVLSQRRDVGEVTVTGGFNLTTGGIRQSINNPSGLFGRLVEDNTRNVLGHLSKERFVIMDRDIISSTFKEERPQFTTVRVNGAEPIVGAPQGGTIAGGIPIYSAFGADFDTWRQYGWKSTETFDRPFLWSAEQQCAPYAKMLLSRERRNIVQGSVKVRGNEFYQLGDVVFVNDRQMLFYVEGITHSFNYEGSFDTTLTLKYGHPPGIYIPSPLDIIGKNLSNKSGSQTSYRIRRERNRVDKLLGVVKFDKGKSSDLMGGTNGARNQSVLEKCSTIAKANIDPSKPKESSRVYVVGFNSSGDKTQVNAVKNWLIKPKQNLSPTQVPTSVDELDLDSLGGDSDISGTSSSKSRGYSIDSKLVDVEVINQTTDLSDLSDSEKELIKQGIVANNESWLLDKTLETVVEIRLKPVPIGGWD